MAQRSIPTASYADKEPVVTSHQITLGGKPLTYKATTGLLPLRNEQGDVEAGVFFIAYTAETDQPAARRPLMFSFNGGPGSASVWLHLGVLGPKRIRMNDDGSLPPPPYVMEDNQSTWLDKADIVFIDPVGTGYSRATKPELARKYNGFTGDIESVGEIIRLYLTRYNRWHSPLFLIGESYGTTRAAGLAGHLADRGIAFNGIVLVSSILNFQTARFTKGNDLPYMLFLPTYTATAWYHKKLAPDLQKDLRGTLAQARAWAESDYWVALAKGDRLTGAESSAVAEKLARFTGLSKGFVERSGLRIEIMRFIKELLREKGVTVGRLDSRLTAFENTNAAETPQFDPSNSAIRPPYTAAMSRYLHESLNYRTDQVYYILGGGIAPWDYSAAQNQFADTSDSLRQALAKNPHMKVLVCSGYYDLATPFFATEYTLAHMGLDPRLRGQIRVEEYEAGHMMYIHTASLVKMKRDGAAFIDQAVDKTLDRAVTR
ncbi:MAG: peptidase S10 [Acidobacteria bacterium]|nr:peptidase S10 [Acidobacteriota bacterium]